MLTNASSIAQAFKTAYSQEHELQQDSIEERGDPPTDEVMKRWLAAADDAECKDVTAEDLQDTPDSGAEDEDDVEIPSPDENSQLIRSSPAYECFLRSLRREVDLRHPAEDGMQAIRETILRGIPRPHRISSRESPRRCQVFYDLAWNPIKYLSEQEYGEPPSEALAKAITVTGSWQDAQALSCQAYLSQTWPSTGPHTMRLIQDLLRNGGTTVRTDCEYPT